MAIAGGSTVEYRKDEKTRYVEEDNIKDVTKEDLKSLKSTLKLDTETDLDTHLKKINDDVETVFDGFFSKDKGEKRNESVTLTVDNVSVIKTPKEIIMSGSDAERNALGNYIIDLTGYKQSLDEIKDEEIKATLKDYTFELKNLRKTIAAEDGTENGAEENKGNSNVLLNDKGDGTTENKENEKYAITGDYVSKYPEWKDIPVGKEYDIENIYKDNKLVKIMEKVFDDEDGKELHKGTFRVNLSKEDGLVGIIITIREAIKVGTSLTPDETSDAYKLYTAISGMWNENKPKGPGLDISRSQLDKLLDDGLITYTRKGGIDDEKRKVAKILSNAQRKDLDAFATLIQSENDVEKVVKKWNNALEVTGQSNEDGSEKKKSLINENNVLEFLCDFNGEGTISTEYKKKNNRAQENQGDGGTLSGPQVMWTIEQAIKIKEVELGTGKGEQLVIQNIIKNMDVSDKRKLTNTEEAFIDNMMTTPEYCTKANLSILINGYHYTTPEQLEKDKKDKKMKLIFIVLKDQDDEVKSFDGMPEMKILFQDAIQRLNGGSEEVTPDLAETLVGDEAKKMAELDTTETKIKASIDERLAGVMGLDTKEGISTEQQITIDVERKELRELIRTQGVVRVRETIFTALMKAMNNVTITTNNGAKTNLQAGGVSKSRELRSAKKEILEQTTKTLVGGGIHYSATDGLRLTIGIGQNGKSASGRTTWNRGAETGVVVGTEGINLYIGISGEVAEQYNYGKVINARLSKVKSAQYFGVEAGAGASISVTNGTGIEVSGGINRQQDKEEGINQIDKQYTAVSHEIFDINGLDKTKISDKTEFTAYIEGKITGYTGSKYKKFVETNRQDFIDNLTFMVKYMDANKFFGTDGKIDKLPEDNRIVAMNSLLDIIQSGNIETRRSDLIAGLHGSVALTKLSFGVTTSALTFKNKGSSTPAPTADVQNGETPIGGDINSGGSGSEVDLGENKFGIAGFYIGLRLSTWRTMYVPNNQQYLYAQYEMGQGIADYIKNPERDTQKYAKYLQALYNDTRLVCEKDKTTNKIIVTFTPETGSTVTLAQFLNLHATTAAEKNFSLKNNTLTIGNVGEIGAYTVTEPQGVRRILSLGTKKLDETHRITDNKVNTTIEEISDKVTGSKNRAQTDIDTKITDNMKGPITTSAADILKIKTETKTFFDTDGKLITPTGATVTYEGCAQGDILTAGTLTITKTADKIYTVKLVASTAPVTATSIEKMTIEYIDKTIYDIAINNITNRDKKEAASAAEIKTTLNMPTNITSVFIASTEKALSIFDDYNQTLYREFMESIMDTGLDEFINATDYTTAFNNLKKILDKNTKYNDLIDLKALIEKKDMTINEKMLIVDKFKTIFSYITYLTDGNADGTNLASLISGRKNIYTTMKGPDGSPYPLTTDYRKTILSNLKGENQLTRTRVENLIGFTAFYRLDGQGRKYAMTPVGGTNVLTGSTLEESMISIEGTDKVRAQEWFIKNLDTNSDNKQMVIDKINLLLKKNNITISQDQLPTLLKGEEITIDSSKKISIDINGIFYLLGECGNESFGIQINKINISTIKPDVIIDGKYTATGTTEKTYDYGMKVIADSHSITGTAIAQELRIGGRHHQGISTKPTANVTNGNSTGGGTPGGEIINSGNNGGNE